MAGTAPMKVVYSEAHLGHGPDLEVQFGVPKPTPEVPARAEEIRRTLAEDERFVFVGPVEHGREPIEAVHEPAMVRYLEGAWPDWLAWRQREGL
jgi:acetoin utilization deacetylase AcuC-like enzyme